MRRAYPLMAHETIDVRLAVRYFDIFYPPAYARTAWVGMCKEIVEALYGSTDHIVERHDGRLHIWRKGYIAPHFIEVDDGAFCCPYWNYDDKNG